MDDLKALNSLGLSLPSPAYLFGALVFGLIGFAAYRYGKARSLNIVKWIGVVLMLYPYAISSTLLLYVVGCGLCIAAYLYRR